MEVFTKPSSMEPLTPKAERHRLSELSCEILKTSGKLTGQVHSQVVFEQIAQLVRGMNSYYSNLIEGHKTTPLDIERALKKDFSDNKTQRDNQLLGVAHIAAENEMLAQLKTDTADVYSSEFISSLHSAFYRHLPEELHWSEKENGQRYQIEPGKLRDFMVGVGTHTPPNFKNLDSFLNRFHSYYSSSNIPATERLVAIAAAHHRLAWIHPFGDGNGRVARLHTQALLVQHHLDDHQLWTLSRGLARDRGRYYQKLAVADQPRRSDFDGRGNLSDAGLSEFCIFFLETTLDQIQFMSSLLELPTLRTRIERYFQFEALSLTRHRESLMRIVRTLADEGEISRTRVQEITGKRATVAAEIIKLGLSQELFATPSPKGTLRISFPQKILPFYFPNLFLDLPNNP